MPLAAPVIASIVAASVAAVGTGASLIEANQSRQDAKGAANAQEAAIKAQTDTANKQTQDTTQQKANQGGATQAAAIQALRASLSANTGASGSILTSPAGTGVAPTQTKTLLGN